MSSRLDGDRAEAPDQLVLEIHVAHEEPELFHRHRAAGGPGAQTARRGPRRRSPSSPAFATPGQPEVVAVGAVELEDPAGGLRAAHGRRCDAVEGRRAPTGCQGLERPLVAAALDEHDRVGVDAAGGLRRRRGERGDLLLGFLSHVHDAQSLSSPVTDSAPAFGRRTWRGCAALAKLVRWHSSRPGHAPRSSVKRTRRSSGASAPWVPKASLDVDAAHLAIDRIRRPDVLADRSAADSLRPAGRGRSRRPEHRDAAAVRGRDHVGRFLAVWVPDELGHGAVLEQLLGVLGLPSFEPRPAETVPWHNRVAGWLGHRSRYVYEMVSMTYHTIGAINERLAMEAYARMATLPDRTRRADSPAACSSRCAATSRRTSATTARTPGSSACGCPTAS